MSDSLYPEFFKSGIGKLQQQPAKSEDLLGFFSALEYFRRDINDRREVKAILEVTESYLLGLDLFETVSFLLSNPATLEFELAHCTPADHAGLVETVVRQEMKAGRFAWALRQNTPACFECRTQSTPIRGMLHTLGVATHRLGMFCGFLRRERAPSQELLFTLVSILLGICSDALAGVRATDELQNKILAANEHLQRALRDNAVLARIPAESPNPVLRLNQIGQVLYSNQAGIEVLGALGCQVGDLISGDWLQMLTQAMATGNRHEFEAVFHGRVYDFLIVPVPDAGYANFYGNEITARKGAEAERERLIVELQNALANIKTLRGLVPICAWCKKIRDDRGFWNDLEVFVQGHSDATFSHGVCPDCKRKFLAGRGV